MYNAAMRSTMLKNTGLIVVALSLLVGCTPQEPSHEGMNHGDDMTMGDMNAMLDGKSGDAFDKAFIEAMIPHHQGAIDMAEAALERAGHDEIKAMARDIIEAQQREIDMMEGWLSAWGLND